MQEFFFSKTLNARDAHGFVDINVDFSLFFSHKHILFYQQIQWITKKKMVENRTIFNIQNRDQLPNSLIVASF